MSFSFSMSESGKTEKFLEKLLAGEMMRSLESYGAKGVSALAANTPADTGETRNSWTYKVSRKKESFQIVWYNTNVNQGAVIALLIQYGHGTGTGGYISGQDYINPAMRPIFDQIAEDVWKQVQNG